MAGITQHIILPNNNEAEVSLIGGAGGYGESILVHYGDGRWIVIDSCVDSNGLCLPKLYLEEMGIDIAQSVKYVICTHWHNDHILGLRHLIEACSKDMIFVVAMAQDIRQFMSELISANQLEDIPDFKPYSEIVDIFTLLHQKGNNVKRALQDMLIFQDMQTCCYALSPSQNDIETFLNERALETIRLKKIKKQKVALDKIGEISNAEEISMYIRDISYGLVNNNQETKIGDSSLLDEFSLKKSSVNDRSMALLLKIGQHFIVLGADVESHTNGSGWRSILEECQCIHGVKAGLFKIPHHGSATGYMDAFINEYIKLDSVSKMSTWRIADKFLPRYNMVVKYFSVFPHLFITSLPRNKRKIDIDNPALRKIIEASTEEIIEVSNSIGIVQSRILIDSQDDNWETKCLGSAAQVNKQVLEHFQSLESK